MPIPAKTGPRTRIIDGFSYGCCVVAHDANALGLLELRHDLNILLGGSGREVALQVIRAGRDRELRLRLGASGRDLFERYYSEEVAVTTFLSLLRQATGDLGLGSESY